MSWSVDVERKASLDISTAALWYEEQRLGLGGEFLDRLEAVFERIAENPLQFPRVEEEARRALLPRFPYAVYFILRPERAVIRAVLHLHRHPDTWKR